MRTLLQIIVVGLMGCINMAYQEARAELEVSAGLEIKSPTQFYDPLASVGVWADVGHYGRCWRPSHVERAWRPYCVGQWVWTDAAWYWQSDEPWAWACYHYGYWVEDPSLGWVWVPATQWAPAWVNWRISDDYVGWAPCPPPGISLAPTWFVFVPVTHFHEAVRPERVIVNDRRLVERTRLVANFRREERTIDGVKRTVVVNPGPSVELVSRATRSKFTPLPLKEVVQRTPLPETLKRTTPTPTGNGPQRIYQQPPNHSTTPVPELRPRHPQNLRPAPAPEQAPAIRRPGSGEASPTQRNLPPARVITPPIQPVPAPTGREQPRVYPSEPRVIPSPQKPSIPPPATPPPVRPAPVPSKPQDKDKDR